MLVLDAAATVDLLLRNNLGVAVADAIRGETLTSVVHLDAEVFSALARLHRDGTLDDDAVAARLDLLAQMDLQRLPISGALLNAAWALRANSAARDALYVAAAQALGAQLVTTDRRLSRALGNLALELE